MNGSRSAATSGGRIAFRIAISAAATIAPPRCSIAMPGTTQAANMRAAAATSQASSSRKGRMRRRSGSVALGVLTTQYCYDMSR